MIEAGLRQRRSDTIMCAIYCIVISIYPGIISVCVSRELNVIDSGTASCTGSCNELS